MPLPERYFTALRPSLVSGHFTTAFGATCASSSPSFTMPSKSVATTSRLTSPGTIEQISSTSGRNGRFSLAISDGLVVTPSTRPNATPSLISLMLAVSRKIFIAPSPVHRRALRPAGEPRWPAARTAIASSPLDRHARSRAHLGEDSGVADDLADDVHRARRTTFAVAAHRRRTEENAEGGARRPVREITDVDDFARLLGGRRETDVEIYLVAPRLPLRFDRQRLPDRARRLRIVEPRFRGHRPRRNPDRAVHPCQRRLRFQPKSRTRTHPGRQRVRRRMGAVRVEGTRSLSALIVGERGVERSAVGDRRPSLALHCERAGAGRGGRGQPGVAVALVLNEKSGREDVAGAGRVDLARRPRLNLVALAVHEH